MKACDCFFAQRGPLLAINILFLIIWGFAGFDKLLNGMPGYFPEKFGATFMAKFPGLAATFWSLALAELAAFAMAAIALARLEFLRDPLWLARMLAWSLFVFLMLAFGQWLTREFAGAFQQFCYFTGTLIALRSVLQFRSAEPGAAPRAQ